MRVEQKEIDDIVSRIRVLVSKYGGNADELKDIRRWYSMVYQCPEPMALMVLTNYVEKLEEESKKGIDYQI